MLNYLPKERVIHDHQRFSQAIKEGYDVESCEVFEEVTKYQLNGEKIDAKKIGYVIQKDQKQFIVSKFFSENEQGELSLLPEDFTIESVSGEVVAIGVYSLGDVFEKLDIRKVQTS